MSFSQVSLIVEFDYVCMPLIGGQALRPLRARHGQPIGIHRRRRSGCGRVGGIDVGGLDGGGTAILGDGELVGATLGGVGGEVAVGVGVGGLDGRAGTAYATRLLPMSWLLATRMRSRRRIPAAMRAHLSVTLSPARAVVGADVKFVGMPVGLLLGHVDGDGGITVGDEVGAMATVGDQVDAALGISDGDVLASCLRNSSTTIMTTLSTSSSM